MRQTSGVGADFGADAGAWFSVRCVFQSNDEPPFVYEERITLWRASSADEAITLAEAEAVEYAGDVDSRYVGLAQSYELVDQVGQGAEVFSLMRVSELRPGNYLDSFFDTGSERQQTIEERPERQ
jgi:hypothetical protein